MRDPHQDGSWGFCPLYAATGLYCPGCGGLRAVNDLTHGDLAGALSSNLLVVLAVPIVVWLWVRWFRRAWQTPQPPGPQPRARTRELVGIDVRLLAGTVLVVATVAFTLLRNTTFGAWLAP
ncbi:MAG: DUF2752 domain-containing protein [Nocardioidaceae bacterium]|nr:MAG: DUF2752 domain-containing protein [Nocardioidaceae bacterium]